MKIKKVFENNKTYHEVLGHRLSLINYLVGYYVLWLDAENLEHKSADDFDTNELTKEQKEFILAFIQLWDITEDFEKKYSEDEFITKLYAKKYNL